MSNHRLAPEQCSCETEKVLMNSDLRVSTILYVGRLLLPMMILMWQVVELLAPRLEASTATYLPVGSSGRLRKIGNLNDFATYHHHCAWKDIQVVSVL